MLADAAPTADEEAEIHRACENHKKGENDFFQIHQKSTHERISRIAPDGPDARSKRTELSPFAEKVSNKSGVGDQGSEKVTGGFAAAKKLAVRVVLRPFPAQSAA
ncbi:MAG: hypothetical protein LBI59_09630 [Candidatus Accumulibacter sp.]|nr:hypothetical protein [Accumulibacter sp.]